MTDTPTNHSTERLSHRCAFLVSQVGAFSAARFAERLEPLGLSPRHFAVLSQLAATDGQSQQMLADALRVHRNGMVALVDDLEERGLAQRRRHPDDRRAHAVHLTLAARELLERAHGVVDELEDELLAGLNESDRRQLEALLQHVAVRVGLSPGVHPGLSQAQR